MQSLRLISINTWKCDGVFPERIYRIANSIKSLHPDVIVCQECYHSSSFSTAQVIADTLGCHVAYLPARYKMRVVNGDLVYSYSGLSIISKWPISQNVRIDLPSDLKDGERIAQFCVIESPESSFLIINTHLTHLKLAESLRINQLAVILEHYLRYSKAYPCAFLCGDMNCIETSAPIQFLLKQNLIRINDLFAKYPIEKDRNTLALSSSPRCIDYIFSLQLPNVSSVNVHQAVEVLNQKTKEGWLLSDHFGLMIDLTMDL